MPRLLLLPTTALVGALVLGCTDQSTPTGPRGDPALSPANLAQAVVRFTRQEPFAFDVESPCTGELIHFTGEIKEQVTSVGPQELLDQGSALHFEDHAVISGRAPGR